MHNSFHRSSQRRKSSDILNGGADALRTAWASAEAATEFAPLPDGTYIARIVSGGLNTAKKGTPGYKLTFRVIESPSGGEHVGRQF